MEECAIGAAHSLDAFNFLSGVLFAITFVTLLLIVLYRSLNILQSPMIIKLEETLFYSIPVLMIVIIIMGTGDIVYSFYIASQVYGQFEEFQQGQVNCSSSVYYSSFVSIIIVFNYIFIDIGLFVAVCLWFCMCIFSMGMC